MLSTTSTQKKASMLRSTKSIARHPGELWGSPKSRPMHVVQPGSSLCSGAKKLHRIGIQRHV